VSDDLTAEEAACGQQSFSIEAEDLLVWRLLYGIFKMPYDRVGFYVDIGAFDPIRHSNTHAFYKRGWRGINVEPNPQAVERFRAIRPGDINLNVAIGQDGQTGRYVSFDEPLLNGFLEPYWIDHHRDQGRQVLAVQDVASHSINTILAEHVPVGIAIDYLNIDVEMMEQSILAEWDFARWRPSVISVEIHANIDIASVVQSPIVELLQDHGYVFTSRMWHTSLFTKGY